MKTVYKFTTDAQFRLVDIDPILQKKLAIPSLKFPIDEFVARQHLPSFLGELLNVFRGKPMKDHITQFQLPNKKTITFLVSMRALVDKKKHVTKIKGEVIDMSQCDL